MDRDRWERIQELFHQLSGRPPREQRERLAEIEDVSLAREVASLLGAESGVESRVMGAIGDVYASSLVTMRERIGPYRVLGELGQGGMSTVFLGERDDQHYRMKVAIKLIKRGMETDEIVRRFRQERHILAGLDHPHICKMLDGGTTEDGLPYFVMEHIEGEPLDGYCDRHQLSIPARLKLFTQICSAVQYAHQNLVIHRDLKPSNLLVTRDGVPKLLDFGIAKLLDPDQAIHSLAMTSTGLRLLTPDFSSPEQVRGESLSTATDIYSLGLLLYHLLTGTAPYQLDTRRPTEIERVVCETEPLRPSLAVARRDGPARRQLQRQLSGDLDNIILKALHKEPRERYASVEQLSSDVERHLAGMPVRARPATWRYRLKKFVRRHRLSVLAAGLVFLSLVAGIITTTWQARRAEHHLRQAEAQYRRAENILEFLIGSFQFADPKKSRRREVTVVEMFEQTVPQITQALEEQPGDRAALMNDMGRVAHHLGKFDAATELLRGALAWRRISSSREEVAETLTRLGEAYLDSGAFETALPILRETLQLRLALHEVPHPLIAESLSNLGTWHYYHGDWAEAERHYRQSLAMLEGDDSVPTLLQWINLAATCQMSGKFDEAESLYVKTLPSLRGRLGDDHPDVLAATSNLLALYYQQRRFAAAEPLAREVLATERRVLGDDHLDVSSSLSMLASMLYELGEFDEAAARFDEALRLRLKLLGEEAVAVASTRYNLGNLALARGEGQRAETLHRQALRVREKHFGLSHPKTITSLLKLADALAAQTRLGEAEAIYREADQRQGHGDGHGHGDLEPTLQTDLLLGLAAVQLRQESPLEALETLRRVPRLELADDWRDALAEALFAACALARGDQARAASLSQTSLKRFAERLGTQDGVRLRLALEQLRDLFQSLGDTGIADRFGELAQR